MRCFKPPEPAPQNLLLDDSKIYQSLNEASRRLFQEGWQHPLRQTVLGLLPADKLGEGFSPDFGRPNKEIHYMIGLVLIAEFKQLRNLTKFHYYKENYAGQVSPPR